MSNKKQTKQCAIYTRVSTDAQAEKDFSSCESQEEKIRTFIASQNNWQVAKVYTDAGYTGATLERPALQQLFQDLKKEKIKFSTIGKLPLLPSKQKRN